MYYVYRGENIRHNADLGNGLKLIKVKNAGWYRIVYKGDYIIRFNIFGGVVFAETDRKGIPEDIKKYVTKLFLEWNPTIEIDWDSYYLTWEFRKIELRMKPVPVENPKYCLA